MRWITFRQVYPVTNYYRVVHKVAAWVVHVALAPKFQNMESPRPNETSQLHPDT